MQNILRKECKHLHFPMKGTYYNYHDTFSSFFDLYIAGHYRLSGLRSPMVYSLIQILKDVQRTHIKSAVLDSWILSIVSACLFDVCKGVQYLYHTAYRQGLFHSFSLLRNPSIVLDRAAQPA